MELVLQGSVEQSHRIFENVGDGLVVTDLDSGMLLAANPAYCKMHGYSYNEIVRVNPFEVIPSHRHGKFREFLATVKAGQEFTAEADCRKPDGTPFWIELKAVPFTYHGQPTALSVIRDVTERKQMERVIRDREQQTLSIFENVSDGLVVIDLDTGMLLTANPAYCQMHGYDLEELLSLDPLALIPVTFHDKYHRFLVTVKAGQQFTCEANCRKPDGSRFCIEIKSVPFWFEGRQTALSVIRDVTDRKQLEQTVQRKNARLERALTDLKRTQVQLVQSEKMSGLSQLVAGVAHELNNPVSFIHGNLDYIQDYVGDLLKAVQLYQHHYPQPHGDLKTVLDDIDIDFLQQDLGKILNSVEVGSERIREIVLALRNFSRIDEAERKKVNIHEGLDNAVMLLQHRLDSCPDAAAIEVVRDYGDLPPVQCYPSKLNQVFMNILANAIDALLGEFSQQETEDNMINVQHQHSRPKRYGRPRQIHVRTSMVDDAKQSMEMVGMPWVEIAIANNGSSIPESLHHTIFEPFFTTKPVGQGTGMGLPISYQIIVERHRGRLTVHSSEGNDTEFVIQIPIDPLNA